MGVEHSCLGFALVSTADIFTLGRISTNCHSTLYICFYYILSFLPRSTLLSNMHVKHAVLYTMNSISW